MEFENGSIRTSVHHWCRWLESSTEDHRATMVKTCRTFHPTVVYSMDAAGVIFTSLPKKLEWRLGNVCWFSENARIAGQSSACNDLQPRALVVGEVHRLMKNTGNESIQYLPLPRRSACRRSCWEIRCDQCKALRKRKK